jgi:hypothetical protein
MSTQTTMPTPVRLRHGLRVAIAVAAVAAAGAAALLAIGPGTNGTEKAKAPSAGQRSTAAPVVGAGLTPTEKRYVAGMAALSPARAAAAFGHGAPDLSALTAKERRYVEGISSLTPAQLAAAYGSGR